MVVVCVRVGMAACDVSGVSVRFLASSSSSSSFLFVFFFLLVVGVRGSARAALRARTLSPNTIVSFVLFVVSSSLAFLHHPLFPLLEWRWGVHHVSLCSVGMTATGSLSRLSPFFW